MSVEVDDIWGRPGGFPGSVVDDVVDAVAAEVLDEFSCLAGLDK